MQTWLIFVKNWCSTSIFQWNPEPNFQPSSRQTEDITAELVTFQKEKYDRPSTHKLRNMCHRKRDILLPSVVSSTPWRSLPSIKRKLRYKSDGRRGMVDSTITWSGCLFFQLLPSDQNSVKIVRFGLNTSVKYYPFLHYSYHRRLPIPTLSAQC